jgi:hypothetical protein
MTTRQNALKKSMLGMQDAPQPAPSLVAPASPKAASAPQVTPSRQGKRVISGYFDATAFRQLKMLSVERDETVQSLLGEAINDLFRKYGKSPVA